MKAKWLCTKRSTYKMIAAVWAASLLLSSPTLHIMVGLLFIEYARSSINIYIKYGNIKMQVK